MDPLSVTASVISVIQAAGKVIAICCDYRSSVKGSSWEVSRILEDTRSLRIVLQGLEEVADKAETAGSAEQSRLPALRSLCDSDTGILSSCYTELERLTRTLTPPAWSGPAGSKRRALVEVLSWPLKKKETEKALASIIQYKNTISIAVHTDQIPSLLAIEDVTLGTKLSLTLLQNDTHEQNVRNWLHAIDPHPKYMKTIDDRLPGTGAWLTDDRKFDGWKEGRDSRLWLFGIPGCGKTVLCSTAIENVLEERTIATNISIGIAYFFFDFNNRDQQYCDTMLRSLISQLWLQHQEGANAVDALYSACGSGASQPSSKMLKNALKELVKSFSNTFIVLDALDECKERQRLLPSINEMAGWKSSSLHMLVTSRKERDIEDSLSAILDDEQRICIQSALIKDDIRNYVRSRIQSNYKLKKWQTEIETVLMEKAGGMFQWVKCQLDALGRCLSLSSLRKALRSLPKDLDDTYARILQHIDDDEHSKLVTMIMQWLAYSERPMTLTEISEALTVDLDDEPQSDVERRLEEPQDILRICSGLVTTVRWQGYHAHLYPPESDEILQFAHFSVREYLESARILDGPSKKFAINEIRANQVIAESCIIYLLHLKFSQTRLAPEFYDSLREEYPLVNYAGNAWRFHAECAKEGGNIVALGVDLLFDNVYGFSKGWEFGFGQITTWFTVHGPHLPLLYASAHDIPKITSALIMAGTDVNASDTHGWTPLMEISRHHHERIELVQLLLKHGADINAQTNWRSTALMSAAKSGNLQTVRILLDSGAETRDSDVYGNSALNEAARYGHTKVVRHLLDRGVSTRYPTGARALSSACNFGHSEIVEMFLEQGIGVDAKSMHASLLLANVLFRILLRDKKGVAKVLLRYGADINANVGPSPVVALQYALDYGKVSMANFLLEHGADPNLVVPEQLYENGMRLYKEKILKHETQNSSTRVQEVEAEEEAVADA